MNNFKPARLGMTLLCILTLSGCASVKMGEKDTEVQLKQFVAVPAAVSLYVCREKALLFAAGVRTTVLVDNKVIGTLKPNMFAHTLVSPGKHEVFLKRDGIYGGSSGIHVIDTKPGEVAFVWAGMTGGGFGTLTVDNFDNTREAMDCVRGAEYSVVSE